MADNMLAYNKIYSQQTLNKKWLLKRKGKRKLHFDLAFSFRIRLLGDMLLLRDCLDCIFQYIRMLSVQFNSSTFLWLSTSPSEYGTANYINDTCYFDEMMKAYINIKNNCGLHPHQILNKRIWLMKRESGLTPHTHRFLFGERFDETLMRVYCNVCQCVILSSHQFIGFSSLTNSAGKATEVNTSIRRLVGRTFVLPTDKEKPMLLAKRKRQPMSADITADTA